MRTIGGRPSGRPLLVAQLLLVVLASAFGCTGGSGAPPATSGTSIGPSTMASPSSTVDESAPAAPSPARTAAPTAAPAGVLVVFDRRGGLAGFADQISVRSDGAFTLTRQRPRAVTRSGRLTATELANLREVLARSGFATLPKAEMGDTVDAYVYSVSYGGAQIVAQEGAVVPALGPVIADLSALVAKYGA
jgi:hypothetical protein